LNTLGIGFSYKIPYGIRIKIGNSAIFFEMRTLNNIAWFNRGRYSDEDSVSLYLSETLLGLDISF
jgi:hypothetical protein